LYLSSHKLYMSAAGMWIFHCKSLDCRTVSLGPASKSKTSFALKEDTCRGQYRAEPLMISQYAVYLT